MTKIVDIPDDDPARTLSIVNPDAAEATHLSVVGDTYTILVSGDETEGRYCLIDMHIPDGGGPPPHRHDFEESFTLLEGRLEVTFRGETRTVRAPATVHIPANAPHGFANSSGAPARVLSVCASAGQERFFAEIGDPVDGRTAQPPDLSKNEIEARTKRAVDLAPAYRTKTLT